MLIGYADCRPRGKCQVNRASEKPFVVRCTFSPLSASRPRAQGAWVQRGRPHFPPISFLELWGCHLGFFFLHKKEAHTHVKSTACMCLEQLLHQKVRSRCWTEFLETELRNLVPGKNPFCGHWDTDWMDALKALSDALKIIIHLPNLRCTMPCIIYYGEVRVVFTKDEGNIFALRFNVPLLTFGWSLTHCLNHSFL